MCVRARRSLGERERDRQTDRQTKLRVHARKLPLVENGLKASTDAILAVEVKALCAHAILAVIVAYLRQHNAVDLKIPPKNSRQKQMPVDKNELKKFPLMIKIGYLARVLIWLLWGCKGANELVHCAVSSTDKASNRWHLPRSHAMG